MAPAAHNDQGQAPSVAASGSSSLKRSSVVKRGRASIGSLDSSTTLTADNQSTVSEWGATTSPLLDSILDEESSFSVNHDLLPPRPAANHDVIDPPTPTRRQAGVNDIASASSSTTQFNAVSASPPSPTSRMSPPLHGDLDTLIGLDTVTRTYGDRRQALRDENGAADNRASNTTINLTAAFPSPPATRPKVRGPRLSVDTTSRPESPQTSDTKPVGPEMAHWKQVRDHVLVPTPIEERRLEELSKAQAKKRGLMSKAAGRFGMRSAAESAMGYDRRRHSTFGAFRVTGNAMTQEEKEEASRQRRKFGREIKNCLDTCSAEESRRRLRRLSQAIGEHGQHEAIPTSAKGALSVHNSQHGGETKSTKASSVHSSAFHLAQSGEVQVSAFQPLLNELHKHLPDARSKRIWSLTCPHHSAILSELGTTFLPDSSSTNGERAQVLEVFGTVVKYWQTESADEELERWLWLCRAMMVSDRSSRNRGLQLLASMLKRDGTLAPCIEQPQTASEFESLAIGLLSLLHALENADYASDQQQEIVLGLLRELGSGAIIRVQHESLVDVMADIEMLDTTHGVEEELLWMAVARAISASKTLSMWLLDRQATVLQQFAPPPALPGMPELIRRLRMLTTLQFLGSLGRCLHVIDDPDIVSSIEYVGETMYADSAVLPGHDEALTSYITFLVLLVLPRESTDPSTSSRYSRVSQLLRHGGVRVEEEVASSLVASFPLATAATAIRELFEHGLSDLGGLCIPHFLRRLHVEPATPTTLTFLRWLSTTKPQLFYKPLFACAASTHSSSLSGPLSTVRKLSELLGSEAFWTQADPQMVVILLVSAATPPRQAGDSSGFISVKLGRYAVLVELILAVKQITKPSSHVINFLATIESRLGAMLEIEERDVPLPPSYRSLVVQLLGAIRTACRSIKRTAATRLSVAWFTAGTNYASNSVLSLDGELLQALSILFDAHNSSAHREVLYAGLQESLASVLVTIQASITSEEWVNLLPIVWERYGQPAQPIEQLTFLLMRCTQAARGGLRNIASTQLLNSGPNIRQRTLLKLAQLFGCRFQVLSQATVSDKRGLTFKFSHKTLDFVLTEMGSEVWVSTRDAKDAALQKYGRSLPLEMRQRLLELGWTDDDEMSAADTESVPVTMLPLSAAKSTSGASNATHAQTPASPSAGANLLDRKSSNASVASLSSKVHRAVIPPELLALVMDQARLVFNSGDINVNMLSWELVRMFEREEAKLFVRPAAENLQTDMPLALSRLNSVIAQPTPGFAYSSLNSLGGFLKTAIRADPTYPHWAMILGTVARLIPFVSEMSLRSVRKSKAENVLLPASIHEDESGLKIHLPWHNNAVDVQTAQLLVLASLLLANAQDVYLVKKMMFNLQVQGSMRNLSFARAWLELIVVQFSAVNSNYNDRAELRHFLFNISTALALHGTKDIIVTALALRALMLCASRFRRVFASIGFVEIMRTVYTTYAFGNAATRDAIEYACRSFYRIHQDIFVFQMCMALGADPFDSQAAYNLVDCLSVGDTPQAGVPSGIRGLNNQQEIEALLQMLSGGAQVSLSELAKRPTGREEQQQDTTVSLEPVVFPRHHIVKLIVTVVAANAASERAIKFMNLFASFIPFIKDEKSQELLGEAVEVIGRFVYRRKSDDDTKMQRLLPGEESGPADWDAASRAYVGVVDQFTRSGGKLGAKATRRFLDIVGTALSSTSDGIRSTASSALGALARTELAGKTPTSFLRDLSPAFRQHITSVDFSRVLESITELIQRDRYQLPDDLVDVVVHSYVEPAIRMLAIASEDSLGFIVPLRRAAVELLGATVFLPGSDSLDVLEQVTSSPGLLAGVILPLTLVVERPAGDMDAQYSGLWVRLIRIVIRPNLRRALPPLSQAALAVLSLQILKIVTLRAPDAISSTRGLWAYLSHTMLTSVSDGNGRFFAGDSTPRMVDWMMWTLFELLALHRSPLQIDMRLRIQTALAEVVHGGHTRPSSPDSGINIPKPQDTFGAGTGRRSFSGMVRRPSARRPSFGSSLNTSITTHQLPSGDAESPAADNHLSPALGADNSSNSLQPPLSSGGSPQSSRLLTPRSASGRIRPSFSALAARRASRPHFDAFPDGDIHGRFPSSDLRPLDRGAITHLLGPATVAAATGGGAATAHFGTVRPDSLKDPIQSSQLARATFSAVNTVLGAYGYPVDSAQKVWSLPDALHEIMEQSHLLIEQEFAQVFSPGSSGSTQPPKDRLSFFSVASGEGSKRSSFGDDKERPSSITSMSDSVEGLGYTLDHSFGQVSPLRGRSTASPSFHAPSSPRLEMGPSLTRREPGEDHLSPTSQIPLLSVSRA